MAERPDAAVVQRQDLVRSLQRCTPRDYVERRFWTTPPDTTNATTTNTTARIFLFIAASNDPMIPPSTPHTAWPPDRVSRVTRTKLPQSWRVPSPGPTRTSGLLGIAAPDREQVLLDSAVAEVPLGRVAEPEEIAGAAAFLASDDASFVNGIEFFVDGGQSPNLTALARLGVGMRQPTVAAPGPGPW